MFLKQAHRDAKRAIIARGLRAIGDGFYDTPLETSIVPQTLDIREGELHIIVSSAEGVPLLAEGLAALNRHCQASHTESRT